MSCIKIFEQYLAMTYDSRIITKIIAKVNKKHKNKVRIGLLHLLRYVIRESYL